MSRLDAYIPVVQIFAARVALFHSRVAAGLALNPTDLLCLRLLTTGVATTASELAAETGLSMPAMTLVVDRLAGRGFIRRQRETDDRRRVRLVVDAGARRRLDTLYRRQGAMMAQVLDRYSEAEFALILRYLRETSAVLGEALADAPPTGRAAAGSERPRKTAAARRPAPVR